MKLRSLRPERQPKLMIIPLIDVIFFLLVFFMMSTLYMVEQNLLPINLPQASPVTYDMPRTVSITVTAEGRTMFEQEDVPLDLLQKRVRMELSARPDTPFILRADKDVPYGTVVAALDEVKSGGAKRLSLATEAKAVK